MKSCLSNLFLVCFVGLFLFLLGMGINIHSDLLLRQLRKPGEVTYKIPQGIFLSPTSFEKVGQQDR